MTDLLRQAAAYYDASYPPDILGGGGGAALGLTSVSPNNLTTNSFVSVVIRGSGFTGVTAVELVRQSNDSVQAFTAVTVVNDTTIHATSPPPPAGGANTYHLRVTRDAETAQLDNAFTCTSPNLGAATPNPIVAADPVSLSFEASRLDIFGATAVVLNVGGTQVTCTNVAVTATHLTCDYPGGGQPGPNVSVRVDAADARTTTLAATPVLVAT